LLGVERQVQHSMRDAAWKAPAYIGPDDAVFNGID
jgi:aspartate carbamoyltransferase catalytic subunit